MIDPRFWLRHWKARRAVVGYPLYDVPHKLRETQLPEAKARENFEYFMSVRMKRLAYFQDWLRKTFGVDASLTPEGVKAVDRWTDDYGGGLIGDFPADPKVASSISVFASYARLWEGEHAGLNVAIDLGVFMGEYAIAKRPNLYWDLYQGHSIEPSTIGSTGYRRPVLSGFAHKWKIDVLTAGYECLANSHQFSTVGQISLNARTNVFLEKVKGILYAARLTEQDMIVGDSSNEPL